MASILQTTLHVYQYIPSQPPLHITFKPYSTHIYTDALGLISSLTKTTKLNTLSPLHSPPLLHRDYTDTGILYKHLIQHYHHTTYTHVKAHQEDHASALPTEHGTGNKLADLIAQNKLSDAKLIAPNIKIFTYTLEELFTNTNIAPIIHMGNSPLTPTFYIHHPKITEQRFHTLSLNSWLTNVLPSNSLSSLQWTDISWNLAGTLISKATANKPHLKTFLLKFLYNAPPPLPIINLTNNYTLPFHILHNTLHTLIHRLQHH